MLVNGIFWMFDSIVVEVLVEIGWVKCYGVYLGDCIIIVVGE